MPTSSSFPKSTSRPTVPVSFKNKKSKILAALQRPEGDYTDNSPKGSVDSQIRDLIEEINAYEGFVTTSSCAGRVAVFVEGPRVGLGRTGGTRDRDGGKGNPEIGDDRDALELGEGDGGMDRDEIGKVDYATKSEGTSTTSSTTSPGGKGGGRWLFVSHDPIAISSSQQSKDLFSSLFNLRFTAPNEPNAPSTAHPHANSSPQAARLVHLVFSPLILHIHCATLHHARPLLAAAINAGFRESGVQSLRILDDPNEAERGVIVAVRTAGLGFETVVGLVREHAASAKTCGDDADGSPQRIVSEEYLALCVSVVNERFAWNVERRERLRRELSRAMEKEGLGSETTSVAGENRNDSSVWEDKEDRRRRKREEGLAKRQDLRDEATAAGSYTNGPGVDDEREDLDADLSLLGIG